VLQRSEKGPPPLHSSPPLAQVQVRPQPPSPSPSHAAGTFGALAVMTVLSVGLGRALHEIDELLPAAAQGLPLDDLLAVALLLFFGVQVRCAFDCLR
jgi:hypothetical protein